MATPDPLDTALVPHIKRADRLIVARMADARSHAKIGLVAWATQRLADLHLGLMGPDGSGLIGDARAAAYTYAYHAGYDPDLHDPDRRYSTAEGARAARTAPIGGVDAHRELGVHVERARLGLIAAQAGDAAGRATALDAWHEQHSAALRSWARRRLSDDQVSITAAIGWLRQKPEYRDNDGSQAGA